MRTESISHRRREPMITFPAFATMEKAAMGHDLKLDYVDRQLLHIVAGQTYRPFQLLLTYLDVLGETELDFSGRKAKVATLPDVFQHVLPSTALRREVSQRQRAYRQLTILVQDRLQHARVNNIPPFSETHS